MSRLTRKVNDEQLKKAREIGEPFVREYEESDYCELEGICDRDRLNKLGQLEDIEEEINFDLITLFKALKNGVWVRDYFKKEKLLFIKHPKLRIYKNHIGGFDIPYKERFDKLGYYYGNCRYFVDYGDTWALTKEELL